MNFDEQDELWELLGKAKPVTPSPFFARNVLRKIRAEDSSPKQTLASRLFAWARPRRLAGISAAVLLLLIGVDIQVISPRAKDREMIAQLSAPNSDLEVITHLDELLASEETSLWTDSLQD